MRSVNDFSVNFRAIRKTVWVKLKIEEKGNTFMPEIIADAYFKGYNITQIPIAFKERAYEKSKLNLFKESSRFLIKLGYFLYINTELRKFYLELIINYSSKTCV